MNISQKTTIVSGFSQRLFSHKWKSGMWEFWVHLENSTKALEWISEKSHQVFELQVHSSITFFFLPKQFFITLILIQARSEQTLYMSNFVSEFISKDFYAISYYSYNISYPYCLLPSCHFWGAMWYKMGRQWECWRTEWMCFSMINPHICYNYTSFWLFRASLKEVILRNKLKELIWYLWEVLSIFL